MKKQHWKADRPREQARDMITKIKDLLLKAQAGEAFHTSIAMATVLLDELADFSKQYTYENWDRDV